MEVPPDLVHVSNALFHMRDPEITLARLARDTVVCVCEEDESTSRHLEYRTADGSLTIQAEYSPILGTLWLECSPALTCLLVVEQRGRAPSTQHLRDGAGMASAVVSGWTSVVLHRAVPVGGPIRTSWTLL